MSEIRYGYCHCGCGEKTTIIKKNDRHRVKGEPNRYCPHHGPPRPKEAKIRPDDYIVDENGCWIWQKTVAWSGYGMVGRHSKTRLAHRWYYETLVGPIPDGLHLDHLCRVRTCVNPDHLEVTTRRTNTRRGANTKLTEKKARAIRRYREMFGLGKRETARRLAPRLGVSEACIRDLLRGKTWKDASVPT